MKVIRNIDCLAGLKELPDQSVNCCVTSPPYFGLRDYGHDGQIGLEQTPDEYVSKLVEVFREVRRVLRDDGTLWLNLGDSYSGTAKGSGDQSSSTIKGGTRNQIEAGKRPSKIGFAGIKSKDMIGVPWMVAFALRSDGWYLRQDIIWHKPNPMPESVTDRCTKAHEYIFLLSKSPKYYYDQEAIMQDVAISSIARLRQNIEMQNGSSSVPGKSNGAMKAVPRKSGNKQRVPASERGVPDSNRGNQAASVPWEGEKANKRSVWTVTTKPFKEAHFATFPEDLIVDCIKAGCPKGGIVLDPFMGAGTTAVVAKKLNRKYLGFELNPEYIDIANKRISESGLLFD